MKISALEVFQVEIPMTVDYGMSGGRIWNSLDSTIVRLTTDSGLVGWGESCPWGPNYLPGHGRGVRAALEEVGPGLIGLDPTQIDLINLAMDRALSGHGYAKHAVDMACWDLTGKVAGLPLAVLLGGVHQSKVRCVAGVPNNEPGQAVVTIDGYRRDQGYTVFSCKLTGDLSRDLPVIEAVTAQARPGESYIFDANMGLTLADALRCANVLAEYDVVFESPTATYEEFNALRQRTSVPLMIDEIFTGMETMWRIIKDNSCEMINLKLAKVGGLSPARLVRDTATAHGLPLSVQCCGGSEITLAAIVHLAQSTRPAIMHSVWDCTEVNGLKVVPDSPEVEGGFLTTTGLPGLGVEPDMAVLGDPVAVWG